MHLPLLLQLLQILQMLILKELLKWLLQSLNLRLQLPLL
jgi:hypothetical protein